MNPRVPYVAGVLALGACLASGPVATAQPAPAPPPKEVPARAEKLRVLKLPETPYNYANVELPAHFRTRAVRDLDNTPRDNPITDAGATLGRVLFYDTRLSANGTVACASCHHQKHAFSDPGAKTSKGYEGKLTDRNEIGRASCRERV